MKRSVSLSGLVSLILISSLFIWLDKIAFLIVIFLMFATSSLLTKFRQNKKGEFKMVIAKPGSRDYIQAVCNLGAATGIMLLWHFTREDYFMAAFIGSVAAANADSWASEIGGLSKKQPVMITNFKPVAKGISGGVTLTGILGGIAGAFFISFSGLVFFYLLENNMATEMTSLFFSSFFAGAAAFISDSYLGSWLQALYLDEKNLLTENSSASGVKLIKGWKWMNNDLVNLITTVLGGGLGAIFLLIQKFQ
jgi:uncharacterized protein (TIGR00297 family)